MVDKNMKCRKEEAKECREIEWLKEEKIRKEINEWEGEWKKELKKKQRRRKNRMIDKMKEEKNRKMNEEKKEERVEETNEVDVWGEEEEEKGVENMEKKTG